MSMNLQLKQADAAGLARYLRDGVDEGDLDIVADFEGLGGDAGLDFEAVEQWLEERRKTAPNDPMAAQIAMARESFAARRADPQGEGPNAGQSKPERAPGLDLHKSWHMLHYVFTGSAWEGETPAATLLLGGQEVGEDLGYGPARVLSAEDTAGFARYLDSLDLDQLFGRLDPGAMRALDIYCAPDNDDEVADLGDDLEHYFPQLRAFVADAAKKANGLLIWMA